MAELPPKTREFLSDLSPEDIATIKSGLPIIRMIIGFGKVTKWLAITSLGLMVGVVMLWESVLKIIAWLKHLPG
jgi:hypothetical protein